MNLLSRKSEVITVNLADWGAFLASAPLGDALGVSVVEILSRADKVDLQMSDVELAPEFIDAFFGRIRSSLSDDQLKRINISDVSPAVADSIVSAMQRSQETVAS